MKFKINKACDCPELSDFCNRLTEEIVKKGNQFVSSDEQATFVLNLIDLESPKAYRRKCQEEMVVSISLVRYLNNDIKSACYSALVKSISNILFCICLFDGKDQTTVYSITPEVGFTKFSFSTENMYKYMYPVISSHFVLKNKIRNDLTFNGAETIGREEEIKRYGRELKKLGVLPAPFPLTEFLNKDLIDQLFRLYQIKGLSYGNLSIRNNNPNSHGTDFLMTARGVDKSNLKGIGKDILLVNGFDKETGEMLVSVPVEHDPGIRVSVDAIEHYLIYKKFPSVGAIVHVHAWIDDVLCTTQSYPCGTLELAQNVVALLARTSSPERTEVGLKNHGLTITGPDFEDIFFRIRDRLRTSVPMQT